MSSSYAQTEPAPLAVPALRVGIIGSGPTALYTLKALLRHGAPLEIVLFEAGTVAGPGIPFGEIGNGPEALANIAGIELPPVTETLNAWALRQPRRRLVRWGIAGEAGDDRAFFPRRVLGYYFADQLDRLMADAGPHRILLRRRCRVTDVVARADGALLHWADADGAGQERFDRLVIATGYRAPRRSRLEAAAKPTARTFGILGSSLSAIDAVMRLARRRGRFETVGGALRFTGDTDWHATMLSRAGLLPEADFWFPSPAEPLDLFTDAALAPLVNGRDGDLDAVFAVFARQLAKLDPAYAAEIDLAHADADSFAGRHFARRMASDPWDWARSDLAQARDSHRRHRVQPWRYAILRMHEAFGRIVPHLSAADLARFDRGLKRCFTDNYAAVPHLSIKRLLALHDAGVLDVARLGADYRLIHAEAAPHWHLRGDSIDRRFEAIIDARGQPPLGLTDFPFPTLRLQLIAQAMARGSDADEGLIPAPGFVIDDADPALSRIHCLALPFLLRRNPFVQGLVESAALAEASVAAMLTDAPAESDLATLRRTIAELSARMPVYCGQDGVITVPWRRSGAAA